MSKISSRAAVIMMLALITVAEFAAPPTAADDEPGDAPGRKVALIVATTDYPYAPRGTISSLWGPPQDAALFSKVLKEEFGFQEGDIRILTSPLGGWDSTPEADRPVRANIESAFKRLAERIGPGDQVVILMSMHGTQQPLDPKNPDRTEADGMDEVLLPADATVMNAGDTAIPNGIVDNDIRVWLQAIAVKGAHVWIIFDACCSGGAWRGAGGEERYRFVRPADLGVQPAATPSATDAVERLRGVEDMAQEAGDIDPGMTNIVAFYAARSDLSAPESPLAAADKRNARPQDYHGWLTWSICQVLAARDGAMNYRELAQQVLARYRVRAVPESPFPYGEGDLDREVLGEKTYKERSRIVVQNIDNGELILTAGALLGLTPGSILSVHPRAGDSRPADEVLGYIEVTAAEPAAARARPVAYNDRQPAPPEQLQDGRCEVAMYNFGDARVALAIQSVTAGGDDRARSAPTIQTFAADELPPLIAAALEKLPPARRSLLTLTDRPDDARLLLRVEGDRVRLMPATGDFVASDGTVIDRSRGQLFALDGPDPALLAERLGEVLAHYFKWHNLQALAASPSVSGPSLGLAVEIVRVEKDRSVAVGPDEPFLTVGDVVDIVVRNNGDIPLDVTLLVLDEGFGIKPFFPDPAQADECTIPPGDSRPFRGVKVKGDTIGRESLLAIAVPTNRNGGKQEFTWLAQPSLREVTRGLTERGRGPAAESAFAKLLAGGAFEDADPALRTRGFDRGKIAAAQITVLSWETRRAGDAPQPR